MERSFQLFFDGILKSIFFKLFSGKKVLKVLKLPNLENLPIILENYKEILEILEKKIVPSDFNGKQLIDDCYRNIVELIRNQEFGYQEIINDIDEMLNKEKK